MERLLDLKHPGTHRDVKFIKDVMAAIVLFASIISIILGLIVFLPYIL